MSKPSTNLCSDLCPRFVSMLVIAIMLLSSLSILSSLLSDRSDSDLSSGIPARSAAITTSSFAVSPMSAFVGEVITFTATATSDVGVDLTFTIFYDFLLSDYTENPDSPYSVNVTSNPGQIKTEYIYDAPGPISSTYYVRLSITDGTGAMKNFTRAVAIHENTAPYFAPDLGTSLEAPLDDETFTATLNMSVTCWDNDNDDLSLTWNFGDGSAPVEQLTGPALVGVECYQNHTWAPDPELWYGVGDTHITYYVNLSLADGQGHWTNTSTLLRIPLDHNFSPKGNISVLASTVDPSDEVTIYGNATDAEGEPLTWTFVFSDETEVVHIDVYHTGLTESFERVFQNTTYVFSVPGNYTVTLYITDLALPELQVDPEYAAHNVSVGNVAIWSVGNSVPSVTSEIGVVDCYTGSQDVVINTTTGVALVKFSIQASDRDGDVLNATWDFGDGSEVAYNVTLGGTYVYAFIQIHEYSEAGQYNVSVVVTDGRPGHEVLRHKLITVASDNEPPEIRNLSISLSNGNYGLPGSVVEYEVLLYDFERDPLEVRWDFGDGSPVEWTNATAFDEEGLVTCTIEHIYSENGTYRTWVNFTDRMYDLWGYHQESYSAIIVITGVSTNEAPVANAGPDRIVPVGTEVRFDGSGSSDDVGIVNYTWTFTYDSQPVELYERKPAFAFNVVGGYVVTLTVVDGDDSWDTDTVMITVVEVSEPPVADAGSDQVVAAGDPVLFDGGGSTGDIVSFTWTFEYDGDTETLTGESPTFVFDIAGTYSVTLTVEDADGATDVDTVTITVEEGSGSTSSYDLELGIAIVVLAIVGLALFLGLRSRKGGKAPTDVEDASEEPTRQE